VSPFVMSAVYAARYFFEGRGLEDATNCVGPEKNGGDGVGGGGDAEDDKHVDGEDTSLLRPSGDGEICSAIEEGLVISSALLSSAPTQWSEETGTYTGRARKTTCLRDCKDENGERWGGCLLPPEAAEGDRRRVREGRGREHAR